MQKQHGAYADCSEGEKSSLKLVEQIEIRKEYKMKKQVLENPAKNQDNTFSYLVIITALMVTCYLTSNVMAVKLLDVMGTTWFDAGTIVFPLAYMLGDVLTEIWGYKVAKKVIYLTFFCNILMTVCTYIGVLLPAPSSMEEINGAYTTIFTYTPRILVASLTAFLCGELTNAKVMVGIRKLTKGRLLFARTILSSAAGYILDTGLFVILAFAGTVSVEDLVSMIAIQYVVKLLLEAVLVTPFVYLVIGFLRKRVGQHE